MTQWEGIQEFVAVVETNGFTQAAHRLNTSVVQVSRKVSALENHLGVKLFNRTTRKVSPTEAGAIYYEHCKQLVEGLELAELSVTQMQSTPRGTLKITAPTTYGEQKIAPLVSDFLKLYPKIDIDLNLTNERLDLTEHRIDVAIRLGHLRNSTWVAKKLSSRQLHICASPDYIKKYGTPHSISDLSKHNCLIGSVNHWHLKDNDKSKCIHIKGRLRCNSGIALLNATQQGLGLSQLPDYYVKKHLESGELIEVLQDYKDNREGVWALFASNKNVSPKVRSFVDYLSHNLAN